MHEVSLAEEILSIIEESQRREGFQKVKRIRFAIGTLSGVETEALAFALTHMAPNSVIQDCELLFETVTGSGFCPSCRQQVPLEFLQSPCPRCGQLALEAIEGTSLQIRDLEVI
jgi:hydrogenase nickel incorporation protein HypA/HybF